MKTNLSKSIIIFAVLAIAGVCLMALGQSIANSYINVVLPLVGVSLFTAGLTYFLIKVG